MSEPVAEAVLGPAPGPLTQRVAAIVDEAAEIADAHERNRRVPKELFQLLTGTGLIRAFTPARYGGEEADVYDTLQALRLLSCANTSAAWVVGLLASHQHVMAYFDQETQDEVFATGPDTVVATSGEPVGRFETVEGGIRLSGHWHWSSGSDYATWAMVGFIRPDPETGERAAHYALVHRNDIEVVDTWFTYGMRGTGSNDLKIDDVFVPERRIIPSAADFPGRCPDLHPNGLYRLPAISLYTAPFAAIMLGAGEGALAVQREKIQVRQRNYSGVKGITAAAQMRLGESSLQLRSAASLLEQYWRTLDFHAKEDVPMPIEQWTLWRQDNAYAGEMVVRAVERLLKSSGGSTAFDTSPLQRFWRDVHVMRGHVWFDFDNVIQQHARQILGLPADPSLGG